jgi:hypothetical protein
LIVERLGDYYSKATPTLTIQCKLTTC